MELQSQNFTVSALNASDLEPGASVAFTVEPKTGLAKGEYVETIYLYPVINGEAGEALASVTAKFTVEDVKVAKLTAAPGTLDFGKVQAGYAEAPGTQTVTVTNTGNMVLHLNQPSAGSFRQAHYLLQSLHRERAAALPLYQRKIWEKDSIWKRLR